MLLKALCRNMPQAFQEKVMVLVVLAVEYISRQLQKMIRLMAEEFRSKCCRRKENEVLRWKNVIAAWNIVLNWQLHPLINGYLVFVL